MAKISKYVLTIRKANNVLKPKPVKDKDLKKLLVMINKAFKSKAKLYATLYVTYTNKEVEELLFIKNFQPGYSNAKTLAGIGRLYPKILN